MADHDVCKDYGIVSFRSVDKVVDIKGLRVLILSRVTRNNSALSGVANLSYRQVGPGAKPVARGFFFEKQLAWHL